VGHLKGRHGNIELTAFEQVAVMMEVYRDTCEKVGTARELLFSQEHDFYNADLSLLYTYSVPRVFLNYLAARWSVDAKWVRNQLVGWRRKIDSMLPVKCQVEPLVELFSSLASHAKSFARSENQLKIIGTLERKRLLHFLPRDSGVELFPVLDKKLRGDYEILREKIASWPVELEGMIEKHVTKFSKENIVEFAKLLEQSVNKRLADCELDSCLAKNCQWFINNINGGYNANGYKDNGCRN